MAGIVESNSRPNRKSRFGGNERVRGDHRFERAWSSPSSFRIRWSSLASIARSRASNAGEIAGAGAGVALVGMGAVGNNAGVRLSALGVVSAGRSGELEIPAHESTSLPAGVMNMRQKFSVAPEI